MLKNTTIGNIIALCTLGFTSCHPVYYQPSTQHTPLFQKKGEIYVAGNAQVGGATDGYNIHAAYAMSSHWAIGLNSNLVNTTSQGKSYLKSVNFGYFNSYWDQKMNFEIFSDYGKGDITIRMNQYEANIDLTRFQVQPALGWRWKYIDLIVSSRFSFVKYNIKNIHFMNLQNRQWFEQVNYLPNRMIPIFEPAFTLRAGGRRVKGLLQLSLASEINNSHGLFVYDKAKIHIGICAGLNPFKKN